jgi:glycosyltransferase involved in cell wall biosynthesis
VSRRRRRAVILVANPAAPYSRGLRIARSLAGAGFEVEIAAIQDGSHAVQETEGSIVVRRYRPIGRWVRWAAWRPDHPSAVHRFIVRAHRRAGRFVPAARRFPAPTLDALRRIAWFPLPARGWWAGLRRQAPLADLYHACGILSIGVALDLGRRARRQGFEGRIIYDVIDVNLESNNHPKVAPEILSFYRWKERRWVARADAIVTVNAPIADHLERIWRTPTRPTVLLNCQPRWTPPAVRPDQLRAATGIPPERKVILFLGRLGRDRGLEQAAEATLLLDDAALVLMGFGPWADRLRAQDAEPRFAGRHFTLPPVHPDEVPLWTASADVSIIAVPADSLNQRLSTPNKFWESLTAGTPVVVGRDLEVMRSIVERARVGAIADPADPADLARALAEILEQPPEDLAAMRQRCLDITAQRLNWETAVGDYLRLVDELVAGTGRGSMSAATGGPEAS